MRTLTVTMKSAILAHAGQNSCWRPQSKKRARKGGSMGLEVDSAQEHLLPVFLFAAAAHRMMFSWLGLLFITFDACLNCWSKRRGRWIGAERWHGRLHEHLHRLEWLREVESLVLGRRSRSSLWWKELRGRGVVNCELDKDEAFAEEGGVIGGERREVMLLDEKLVEEKVGARIWWENSRIKEEKEKNEMKKVKLGEVYVHSYRL